MQASIFLGEFVQCDMISFQHMNNLFRRECPEVLMEAHKELVALGDLNVSFKNLIITN
jgi:hypothetical protein